MDQPARKTPAASRVEMTEIVLPAHTNRFGTAFGGTIMSWIDIAGAIAAMRHCESLVVTASIDQLHFVAGAHNGEIVTLRGQVNFAHRTSMEVGVRVECEDPTSGVKRHTATAYLTFVAVDEHGKPRSVPPLEPTTDEERRRCADAEKRREVRLAERTRALERSDRSTRRLER